MIKNIIGTVLLLVLCVSCTTQGQKSNDQTSEKNSVECAEKQKKPINIHIQEFSKDRKSKKFEPALKQFEYLVKTFCGAEYYKISYLGKDVLPKHCKPKARFRADLILKELSKRNKDKNCVLVGVTDQDISTSIHGYEDYGILGLSYCPGNVAIVSNYRIPTKYLGNVLFHEFLHTQGVKHCNNPKCYMEDAKGSGKNIKNHNSLCDGCKKKLHEILAKRNKIK